MPFFTHPQHAGAMFSGTLSGSRGFCPAGPSLPGWSGGEPSCPPPVPAGGVSLHESSAGSLLHAPVLSPDSPCRCTYFCHPCRLLNVLIFHTPAGAATFSFSSISPGP